MRFRLHSVSVAALVAFGLVLGLQSAANAETYTFHHENVLGTSLEIRVESDSQAAADDAEAAILNEITRLSKIFSGYDATSEFSVWQARTGQSTLLSPELFSVLQACDRWQVASQGAFNPAAQAVTQVWKRAEKSGQLPNTAELATVVNAANESQWTLDPATRSATRTSTSPLSLNAIAKGAIVDSACRAALATSGLHGVVVNIGGDLRACGEAAQQVRIANPAQDAVNASPISTIYVSNKAIATSGSYRRGFKVGARWYSHIIDPRTGQPASHVLSATVVAPDSTDADALATILNVLPATEGVALADSIPEVSYLIVTADGRQLRSRDWSHLEQPGLYRFAANTPRQLAAFDDKAAKAAEKTPAKPEAATDAKAESTAGGLLELVVKFELNKPATGQYRRPYVAIWLEDADEFPVRTALLWIQTKQPGPRWHRDLLRWFRNDGVRKLADGTDLIGTISSATRNAGEYKAMFDGKDDAGKPLPAGKYTLFIEVAREHGTYQLIRHKLTLGDAPIAETKLKENAEIKSASVEYRAHSDAPAESDKK